MSDKHELMVVTQIESINGNKLTFNLKYPRYLKDSAQKEADNLLEKLMVQLLGGDIKIKGLSLVWNEEASHIAAIIEERDAVKVNKVKPSPIDKDDIMIDGPIKSMPPKSSRPVIIIDKDKHVAYRKAVDALVDAVKYHLIHLKNVGLNLKNMLGDDEMKRFMHKPGMGEVMITSTKLSTALAAVEKLQEAKDG